MAALVWLKSNVAVSCAGTSPMNSRYDAILSIGIADMKAGKHA